MTAALGAICLLTSLAACISGNSPGSSPAAGTATSARVSSTLAGAADGAASAKANNGLIAFMRPGAVGEYDIWVVRPDGTGLHRLTDLSFGVCFLTAADQGDLRPYGRKHQPGPPG